jgi:hypothetical protein
LRCRLPMGKGDYVGPKQVAISPNRAAFAASRGERGWPSAFRRSCLPREPGIWCTSA